MCGYLLRPLYCFLFRIERTAVNREFFVNLEYTPFTLYHTLLSYNKDAVLYWF